VGLKRLRSSIAMLPQDPTIFSGSIKQNLDPFEEHDDATIWNALDRAQLKEAVEALPKMLETDVRCHINLAWLHCIATLLYRHADDWHGVRGR
jgi:ABC-type multidrug transport system fused ATPase/permease subunit